VTLLQLRQYDIPSHILRICPPWLTPPPVQDLRHKPACQWRVRRVNVEGLKE